MTYLVIHATGAPVFDAFDEALACYRSHAHESPRPSLVGDGHRVGVSDRAGTYLVDDGLSESQRELVEAVEQEARGAA